MTDHQYITEAEKGKPRAWVKLHTSYLDAPELHRVSGQAVKTYFLLYLFAAALDGSGLVFSCNGALPVSVEDTAFRLRMTVEQLTKDCEELATVGLVQVETHGLRLTQYCDEQVNILEIRENAKVRKQKSREESKNKSKSKRSQDVTRDQKTVTRDRPKTAPMGAKNQKPDDDEPFETELMRRQRLGLIPAPGTKPADESGTPPDEVKKALQKILKKPAA